MGPCVGAAGNTFVVHPVGSNAWRHFELLAVTAVFFVFQVDVVSETLYVLVSTKQQVRVCGMPVGCLWHMSV